MKKRFVDFWSGIGLDAGDPIFRLISGFQSQRPYHNLNYIQGCLDELDGVRDEIMFPNEMECAIWFQDLICEIGTVSSKKRSALLAASYVHRKGEQFCNNVSDLIMATRHTKKVKGDAKYMADIDLSILGKSYFEKSEKAQREEHFFINEDSYRNGRIHILNSYLKRKPIFYTDHFQYLYENTAKANIEAEIQKLETFK